MKINIYILPEEIHIYMLRLYPGAYLLWELRISPLSTDTIHFFIFRSTVNKIIFEPIMYFITFRSPRCVCFRRSRGIGRKSLVLSQSSLRFFMVFFSTDMKGPKTKCLYITLNHRDFSTIGNIGQVCWHVYHMGITIVPTIRALFIFYV